MKAAQIISILEVRSNQNEYDVGLKESTNPFNWALVALLGVGAWLFAKGKSLFKGDEDDYS